MTVQKRQKLVPGIALLVNIEFQWYKVRSLFGFIGGGRGEWLAHKCEYYIAYSNIYVWIGAYQQIGEGHFIWNMVKLWGFKVRTEHVIIFPPCMNNVYVQSLSVQGNLHNCFTLIGILHWKLCVLPGRSMMNNTKKNIQNMRSKWRHGRNIWSSGYDLIMFTNWFLFLTG